MFHHLGGRIASADLIIYEFLVDLVIGFKFKFKLYNVLPPRPQKCAL